MESLVLKHQKHRSKSEFVDPDFAEALREDKSGRSSANQQAQRKTQQFCRQVQRALNLALEDGNFGDELREIFVEEVSPAPNCGHLLVQIAVTVDRPLSEAISALRRAAPQLRSEVAATISRKRAPELSFVPAFSQGGDSE